ncbi:MAG: DUF4012 domain-containing protein [Patescibacteria group bacterium]
MKRPALFASEEKTNPVLVVDKNGILGVEIAKELSKELLIILVTSQNPKDLNDSNIITVPYRKKFPVIPDNVYSHIILFDEDDKGIEESISSFIKKAEKDNSVLTYSSGVSEKSQKFSEKLTGSFKKAKAVLYGDIFGEGSAMRFQNPVNFVISQIAKDRKIRIPGEGLTQTYPVYLPDVVREIISAVFGASKEKVFFVFSKHPKSIMSLSHIFQKKDPTITVDFIKGKKETGDRNIIVPGEYILPEDYDFEKKLKDLDLTSDETERETVFQKENSPKSFKFNFVPYLLFFVFLLLLPVLSTSLFAGLGFLQLNNARNEVGSGNLKNLEGTLGNTQALFEMATNTSRALEYEAKAVGLWGKASELSYKIETARKIAHALSEVSQASSKLQNVFGGNSKNPPDDTLAFLSSFKNSAGVIKEAQLNGVLDKSIMDKLNDYDAMLNSAYGLSDSFYPLINPGGKSTYLVLFQNNMELRPGGGFIGSYGILSLDRGKLMDFSIHDVYDADGQLKVHVEPPYAIRRYLPSVHLYLRDSNFNVDFTESASTAANFLFLETGQKADGVIGVDVSFVKELISALGEINVPEYNEKINEHNFFKVTESHVEKNFFPSSTQKKDFLGALFTAIKNNLSERKNIPYPQILKALFTAIEEKHVLFAFSDNNIQKSFSANGWSSRLDDYRDSSQINDFLGINEANLGVNKANFFVGRSLRYELNIKDDGSLSSSAILNLRNDSNAWPGGDYKTYVRIITPQGSSLTSIIIDGQTQKITSAITDPLIYEKKGFKPPAGLEVEKYEENGKTIYGILTIVPQGKSKKIVFNYTLSRKISLKSPLSIYSLKLFKQPGTENYPFDFIASYPPSVTVSSSQKSEIVNGKVVISKTLTADESIELNISRK